MVIIQTNVPLGPPTFIVITPEISPFELLSVDMEPIVFDTLIMVLQLTTD